MTDELMEIFTECIEAIEEGRLTVADCLNQYVQYRFELEQLLLVAEEMRSLPTAKPDPVFREEAPMRLRAKMMVGKPGVNGSSPAGARSPAAAGAVALAQRLLTIPQSLVQMWHVGSRSMWAAGRSVLMFTFLLAGLLFSSSGFSSAAKSRNEMLPVEDRPVTVEVLEGSVEIMAADGKWVPVSKLATVANGQRVRTGDFSSARLTFSDGSSSNIGPNSEVTIQSNFNNNFAPGVGPTPTMTVTATTTPTPTMGVTPTPTPTMTATVTTTPTPTMGVTPTPTPTMSVTPTPRPTIGITPTPTPTVGNTPTPTPGQEMVTICHKPGTPAEKTMTLPVPALNGHMVHGDIMGPCQDISPTPPEPSPTAGGPTPTPGDPTPTPVEPTPTPGGGGMVLVCHKPGTPAQQTMTIPEAALPAHLAHGDTLGACE